MSPRASLFLFLCAAASSSLVASRVRPTRWHQARQRTSRPVPQAARQILPSQKPSRVGCCGGPPPDQRRSRNAAGLRESHESQHLIDAISSRAASTVIATTHKSKRRNLNLISNAMAARSPVEGQSESKLAKNLKTALFQIHLIAAALLPAVAFFPAAVSVFLLKVLSMGRIKLFPKLIDIIVRAWAVVSFKLMGIKISVQGMENLPKEGEVIVTPNHASYLDIFLLSATLPRLLKYVIKSELFKLPLWGWGMYMADHVGIPRGSGRAGIKALNAALNTVKDRVKEGGSFIIFPEGTRSRNGRIQGFKRGAFSVAADTGALVVPVSLVGVNEAHAGSDKYTTVPVAQPKNIRIVVHEGKKLGDEGAEDTTKMRDWAYETVKSSLGQDQLPEPAASY